ncbi:MAG: DUF389 domain-containing protein [Bacteroidota bacterium]|jgi:uncharacterized hydrophobic protein (TIGR00271 family)|nr:DUF389 domain-containing protein [Bacteroidota bacterium]
MIEKIVHYLNLDSDVEEYDRIHETITKDVIFKGTNLWILVFAIIVASVGLNMNSTAVIIGAMLISPLMGPINGMGYSIATYNFPLFRIAVKNFSFAVGASLIASTAYFAISPVSSAQSELLARTSPTIYDVLIALFGGLAGIVAISSRNKGNVIPGVAIATALMPPLCTAGYGLATGKFDFFFGAIYLFTINTVFIALSSVVVSQLLKFPIRTISDEKHRKRVNHWITAVIIITVTPSIYFGYLLVQEERFSERAAAFIDRVSLFEGNYLLRSEVRPRRGELTLIYGGNSFDSTHARTIRRRAADFGLADATIDIRQGFSFATSPTRLNERDKLKGEINRLTAMLQEKERERDSLATRASMGGKLLAEIRPLESRIITCAFSETELHMPEVEPRRASVVVFGVRRALPARDRNRITAWLASRIEADTLVTVFDVLPR